MATRHLLTGAGAGTGARELVAVLRDPARPDPLVVDLRPADRFERLHVRGSVGLPLPGGGPLDALAALAALAVLCDGVRAGRPVVVVAASRCHAEQLLEGLRRSPLPGASVLLAGVEDVADAGGPVVRAPLAVVRLARRVRRAAARAALRAAEAGSPP